MSAKSNKKPRKRNYSNKISNNAKFKKRKFMDEAPDYTAGDDPTNDPMWYAQYPELMKDSASIPYSIPTGTKISWDISENSSYPVIKQGALYATGYQSIPGIVTYGVYPTVGISFDATSPVNVASDLLYTKVRAENSGARNYDSPDLMLYCLAMDQVYSFITWMNRVYGTLMLYSQVNRYLPKAILRAQWVDFDDMILHINDFKAFIDISTAQAAAFSVPNDIKLFNRHAFMYQNIYKDAESAKSQLYQFAPRVFLYYNENAGAGRLEPYDVINNFPNGMKFSDFVTLFHILMDPIISAEDFNIMSGDILKAFGESHLLKLQIMPSGYTVMPIADYEVLTQMKNITLANIINAAALGWNSTTPSVREEWMIKQDANVDYLEWNPRLAINAQIIHNYAHDLLLSTYKTSPEPSDNMVYTRLMYTLREVDVTTDPNNPQYDTYFDSVGSEFITGANVTMFYTDANGDWNFGGTELTVMSQTSVTFNRTSLSKLWAARHFDFCPALYIFIVGSTDTAFYPFFDTDNWTIVHAYELEKMHRTAIMSMLRVPMIGSALPSTLK